MTPPIAAPSDENSGDNALTTRDHYDLVIVGGGMVGASFALQVLNGLKQLRPQMEEKLLEKQFAFSILVIEAFSVEGTSYQPSFDGRSTALTLGTMNSLEQLINLEKDNVHPIEEIEVSQKGMFGKSTLTATEFSQPALGFVIENGLLGQKLHSNLQAKCQSTGHDSVSLEWLAPAEVVSCVLQQDEVANNSSEKSSSSFRLKVNSKLPIEGVQARQHPLEAQQNQKQQSKIIQADFVVLADGAPSRLAESLGVQYELTHYHQSALIANLEFDRSHGQVAYERFTEQGPIAFLPLNDNRVALVWTGTQEESATRAAWAEVEPKKFIGSLQSLSGFRVGKITRVGKPAVYPLRKLIAKEQVRNNLVVLGNAAHLLHPVAGQGFNLSYRDSETLAKVFCDSLLVNQSLPNLKLLTAWQEKRKLDQDVTVLGSHWLPSLFGISNPLARAVRSIGLTLFDKLAFVKGPFAKWAMGLTSVQNSTVKDSERSKEGFNGSLMHQSQPTNQYNSQIIHGKQSNG